MENKYHSEGANRNLEHKDAAARQKTADGFTQTKQERLEKEFKECDKKIDSLQKEKSELIKRGANCKTRDEKKANQQMIKEKDKEIGATREKQSKIGKELGDLKQSQKQSEQRTR